MAEITIQDGYISPLFITDPERRTAELTGPYIAIYKGSLSDPRPLVPILEAVIQSGKPLCVVAHNVQGDALEMLVANKQRGALQVVAVRCQVEAQLDALADATGGIVVSGDLGLPLENITLGMLGRADRVLIDKYGTAIFGGVGIDIEGEVVATSRGEVALVSDHTGVRGRPSSKHLVEAEYQRRIDAGIAMRGLGEEAKHLSDWLKKNYPQVAPMTSDSIANCIRDCHRRYKEATKSIGGG